jgi:hypothetical protein
MLTPSILLLSYPAVAPLGSDLAPCAGRTPIRLAEPTRKTEFAPERESLKIGNEWERWPTR